MTRKLLLTILFFIPLQGVAEPPDTRFVGTYFSGSGNCSECHDGLRDPVAGNVSIVENWSTSMMANATVNPYWQAKVASELHRNPQLTDLINDKCSRCHAPMANEAMKKENMAIEIFGDGLLNPSNPYYNHAMDGVSCTACHQISDDNELGKPASFSGQFTIPTQANPTDRPLYGKYPDPLTGPMRNHVNFTPQYGVHISESRFCSTCHNLKTAFVDGEGNIASTTPDTEFPEQMVYSEWENSAFRTGGAREKSCQACHMPRLENEIRIATRPPRLISRPDFARHTFLGANTTMMDILNRNRDTLAITATAANFETAIEQTRKMLQTSATLEIVSQRIVGEELEVTLKITNQTGHKLPSGYPSRRVFLHFRVETSQGEPLFESGKLNADGSILYNDGDRDPGTHEPHYELITSEEQVQIYEPIMQDTDGNVTHTLLRAKTYIKDNRLTPLGFDKSLVPEDVAVRGEAFTDADFNLGEDWITYRVPVQENRDLVITAELKYQTLAFGHLQDLFRDAGAVPQVATFQDHFRTATIRAETIASVSSRTKEDNDKGGGGALSLFLILLLIAIPFRRSNLLNPKHSSPH